MFMDFKKWSGAVLCLILGLALLGSYINRKADQIKLQKEGLVRQDAALRSLDDLRKEFEQSQSMLTKLDVALPKKEALGEFSKLLESLAKKRALSIKMELGKEIIGNEIIPGTLDFRIIAAGSYFGITGFLDDLRASGYFMKFNNLGLVNKGRNFEANIHGQVFFK